MDVADPVQVIRDVCVSFAHAELNTGVFEWFSLPLVDLNEWGEAIARLQKKIDKDQKKKK